MSILLFHTIVHVFSLKFVWQVSPNHPISIVACLYYSLRRYPYYPLALSSNEFDLLGNKEDPPNTMRDNLRKKKKFYVLLVTYFPNDFECTILVVQQNSNILTVSIDLLSRSSMHW
jgi:hypothetical protein